MIISVPFQDMYPFPTIIWLEPFSYQMKIGDLHNGASLLTYCRILLQDTAAVTAIQQLLLNFDYKDPIGNWEILKSYIQTFCSTCTHFHQK